MAQAKDQPIGVPDRTRDGPQEAFQRDVDEGDGRHVMPEPPTATVFVRGTRRPTHFSDREAHHDQQSQRGSASVQQGGCCYGDGGLGTAHAYDDATRTIVSERAPFNDGDIEHNPNRGLGKGGL
jgi:hypothetical protein